MTDPSGTTHPNTRWILAQFERIVSKESQPTSELPDRLSLYALVMEVLRSRGVLARVAERFLLYRQGGYVGEDLFAFLVGMFSSGFGHGIKSFARRSAKHGTQLAALAGRKCWPSQASVSRALSSTSETVVASFLRFLLVEVGAEWGHRDDLTAWRDAQGQAWDVFNWDTRVTPFRQRGLPYGDDLPEPVRRLDEVAAPGYAGRKQRADVQLSVSKVQHGGSGQWIDVGVEKGNGDLARQQRNAHEAVCAFARANGKRTDYCVVISDGVGGGSTQVATGLDSPARFLTRHAGYSVLESPEIQAILTNAVWTRVGDSGSGPGREATELGMQALPGRPKIRRVVSRYQLAPSTSKRGVGREIEGWIYELFDTDVPTDAFSASDLVTLYYSRCGLENQFASENRELAMGRLYSAHPAGQMLAQGIGMFLWNLEMQMGVTIATQTGDLPEPPVLPTQTTTADSTAGCSADALPPLPPVAESVEPEALSDAPIFPQPGPSNPLAVAAEDDAVNWPQKMARYIGWVWDAELGGPRCQRGQVLALQHIKPHSKGGVHCRFRGLKKWCSRCSLSCGVTLPHKRGYRRTLEFVLTKEESERAGLSCEATHTSSLSQSVHFWQPPVPTQQVPAQPVRPPILLVADVRHIIQAECKESVRATVEIRTPIPEPPRPFLYLALTPSIRQHRRKTWTERRQWNALPSNTTVTVKLWGSLRVQSLLESLAVTPGKNAGGRMK